MNIEKVKTILNEIIEGRGMVRDLSTCMMNKKTPLVPKLFSYGDIRDKAREALSELESENTVCIKEP